MAILDLTAGHLLLPLRQGKQPKPRQHLILHARPTTPNPANTSLRTPDHQLIPPPASLPVRPILPLPRLPTPERRTSPPTPATPLPHHQSPGPPSSAHGPRRANVPVPRPPPRRHLQKFSKLATAHQNHRLARRRARRGLGPACAGATGHGPNRGAGPAAVCGDGVVCAVLVEQTSGGSVECGGGAGAGVDVFDGLCGAALVGGAEAGGGLAWRGWMEE